ncbi:MAG TPA: helix-turn-helix domain-containing protein [Solirubrobacteraceae bacterium]|nr:helix-turn-helix domain-containing protein [Solirubrobacteraceae bacterium]
MNTYADIERLPSQLANGSRLRHLNGGANALADGPSATEVGGGSVSLTGADNEKIVIELSPAQVDRVVRGAAESGNMSVLLSGLDDVREVLAREPRQLEDSRLSRSLLAGLLMLASFPTDGSYLGNAEIARMLDMNPSTTHRYVSTLVAVGLLERDPATRRYRLV